MNILLPNRQINTQPNTVALVRRKVRIPRKLRAGKYGYELAAEWSGPGRHHRAAEAFNASVDGIYDDGDWLYGLAALESGQQRVVEPPRPITVMLSD